MLNWSTSDCRSVIGIFSRFRNLTALLEASGKCHCRLQKISETILFGSDISWCVQDIEHIIRAGNRLLYVSSLSSECCKCWLELFWYNAPYRSLPRNFTGLANHIYIQRVAFQRQGSIKINHCRPISGSHVIQHVQGCCTKTWRRSVGILSLTAKSRKQILVDVIIYRHDHAGPHHTHACNLESSMLTFPTLIHGAMATAKWQHMRNGLII